MSGALAAEVWKRWALAGRAIDRSCGCRVWTDPSALLGVRVVRACAGHRIT